MNIGIVILSRFSSTRLPGKALLHIHGKPVLLYIVERLKKVVNVNQLIIATSIDESDDEIENFAVSVGIKCYRGSLDNVAERFYKAAKSQNWEYAVRMNGDNIFLDINILHDMLSILEKKEYDFLTNVKDRTFPKGMSVEIVRLSFYQSLIKKITSDENYKEHVTLYLYDYSKGNYYYYKNYILPEASGIQMALDTEEDFKRTEQIMAQFKKNHTQYNLEEIFFIWKTLNYE